MHHRRRSLCTITSGQQAPSRAAYSIEVCTYNTDLKNRLTKFAAEYPDECKLLDDDEMGCLTFEVRKGRFGFKLTAPYSEERRKAAGELAKKENLRRNGK